MALGDGPDFVVLAFERLVFGDGVAFADEPVHVVDFVFAVVSVPVVGAFGVLDGVVFGHAFGAVVFARGTGGDFDAGGGGFELGEPFHEGAADDGGPAVGGLHDFDGGVDGGADGFAEVGVLAETADEEDGFDGLVGGGDLATDESEDFLDDGLEDGGNFGTSHAEFATTNALSWVVGETGDCGFPQSSS